MNTNTASSTNSRKAFSAIPSRGGMVWTLGKRPLGKIAWFIPIAWVFAFIPIGFSSFLVKIPLQVFSEQDTPLAMRAFASLFMVAGVIPVSIGALILAISSRVLWGKTRVRLISDHSSEQLQAKDGLSLKPRKWLWPSWRSLSTRDIGQLEVIDSGPNPIPGMGHLAILVAHHIDGPPAGLTLKSKHKEHYQDKSKAPLILAIGYQTDDLKAFANEIAAHLPHNLESHLAKVFNSDESNQALKESDGIETETNSNKASNSNQASTLPKPETAIELETIDGGFSFQIPPRGLKKGSKGTFGFAIIWLVMTAPTSIAFLVFSKVEILERLGLLAFFSLFWAIGLAMLYAAIRSSKTRAVLDVIGHGQDAIIILTTQHPFGGKQQEWVRGDLESIQIGPTGTRINDVPIMALQLITTKGRKHNLLSSRTNEEIKWMASVINAETDDLTNV